MMSFSTLAFRVKLVIQELIKALIIYPSVITGLFLGPFICIVTCLCMSIM